MVSAISFQTTLCTLVADTSVSEVIFPVAFIVPLTTRFPLAVIKLELLGAIVSTFNVDTAKFPGVKDSTSKLLVEIVSAVILVEMGVLNFPV